MSNNPFAAPLMVDVQPLGPAFEQLCLTWQMTQIIVSGPLIMGPDANADTSRVLLRCEFPLMNMSGEHALSLQIRARVELKKWLPIISANLDDVPSGIQDSVRNS